MSSLPRTDRALRVPLPRLWQGADPARLLAEPSRPTHIHIAFELKPATLLKVFDKADAWRRPERFAQLLDACRADFHGRTGFEEKVYSQPDYVAEALEAAQAVPVKEIVAAGFKGEAIREQLAKRRLDAISRVRDEWTFIEE